MCTHAYNHCLHGCFYTQHYEWVQAALNQLYYYYCTILKYCTVIAAACMLIYSAVMIFCYQLPSFLLPGVILP